MTRVGGPTAKGDATRQRAYDHLVHYWREHSYGPTVREMAALDGRSSTGHMGTVLRDLMAEGRIEQHIGRYAARCYRPVSPAGGLPCPVCGRA